MNDLINRKEAIDALGEEPLIWRNTLEEMTARTQWRQDREAILSVPSAQPERKTGRWILWNYPGEECVICSACGKEYDQMELYIGGNDYPKHCPNCGAAMRQPEDDIPMEYFENGGTV